MSEGGERDDFLNPLDLSKFPEGDRLVIERLRDLLTDIDPARIEEHRTLLPMLPDGIGDYEHLGAPAAYSLLAYGRPGLTALYQSSIEDPFSASSRTGRALLAAAVQNEEMCLTNIHLAHRYMRSEAYERLRDQVSKAIRDRETSAEARRLVSKLVAHYASDPDRRHDLAGVLDGLTVLEGRDSPAAKLIWDIMGSATLQISDELCSQAADLIQQDLNEGEYQVFFERHPALLDPLAASIVPRQALGEMWRTDFVIQRFDDQYVFVELEKPRDALFTAYPQPSASLSHALGQVFSWFAWVDDNISYAIGHGFPNIHSPRGLVVIGRDRNLGDDQRRMLRLMNDLLHHRVLIWTYDEVIRNARNVVRNLTSRQDTRR
jgi:hypothetical protein